MLIFDLATKATYQLSTGQLRSAHVDQPKDLFNAFYELIDFDGGDLADDMIFLPAEGWHRTIVINKGALDYSLYRHIGITKVGSNPMRKIWMPSTSKSSSWARKQKLSADQL